MTSNYIELNDELMAKYRDHVYVDFRVLGLEMLLCPFPLHNSGGRLDMMAKNLMQAQMLKGAEFPQIFTGYENIIGQYEFTTTERTQDAEIIAVIPKYQSVSGVNHIKTSPTITVIYLGLKDRKLHYFDVNNFTKTTDGYGYYNKLSNTHKLLTTNSFLAQSEQLSTSPIHNGEEYNLGINVPVAYMTLPETIEDALVISKSLAKKMESQSIKTISILVAPNQHPLNLYGDEDEFKFLPEIGDTVNDNGILCGFRTPTDATFISDTLSSELYVPHPLHDQLYRAPPGSTILDIDFYVNKNKVPPHLYAQVDKYVDSINNYHKKIVETYTAYKSKYETGPEFNTLVSRAIERLSAADIKMRGVPFRNKAKLISKDTLIEFMQIDITYSHPVAVSLGSKLTGRDGNKGVVCAIRDDEDMPIDDYGIRAHMCIDPNAVTNRMNLGQLYEQYINRASLFVQERTKQHRDLNYILEYINDINPIYAKQLTELLDTPEKQEKYIDEVIERGIFLHLPPGLKTINEDLPILLHEKYDVEITPVEFNLLLSDGTKRKVRTKDNVCIGSKYIYLLYKRPQAAAAGMTFVNQFKTPIKPNKSAQLLSQISQTPIRFGEDEIRILNNAATPEAVRRLMCLQANSTEGIHRLTEALLTAPKPTRIDHVDISDQELVSTNTIMAIMHHMMKTCGIESREVRTNPLTKAERRKYYPTMDLIDDDNLLSIIGENGDVCK